MKSAAVSRRLLLSLGSSILKSDRRRTLTTSHFNNYHYQPQQLCTNYTSISRRRSYCSSSISAASIDVDDDSYHPWPEWVSFVDQLKIKGYFKSQSDDDDGESAAAVVYKDMNQLKDACLTFARDRYDLLKSLSKNDIQAVVECGCPNLFRKAVNSAKRLRVFMRLDEGDVCGACNLRGSCDRAYGILKESEAEARTVDLVRILLFYALDPLVFAAAEKTPAPSRDLVQLSAKKLLSQLIQLSETPLDPQLPKPATNATKATKKRIPDEDTIIPNPYQDFSNTPTVEMKRGDWMCPKCNFMNFSRNMQCRQCKEDGPKSSGADDAEMKKGDWICSECTFLNFARNVRCLKCKSEGPKRVDVNDVVMKKGDWNCPKCQFMNFSSNTKCLRCREGRPKRQLNPGEWECPSCDFLNFRKNMACRKCNCERPKESARKYEEHEWNPDS